MIYYDNGELKQDATEDTNECDYCEYNPKTCNASSPTSSFYHRIVHHIF